MFAAAALVLLWSGFVAVETDGAPSPPSSPCFADDLMAALRDAEGPDGGLAQTSASVFGVCDASADPSGAVISALAGKVRRNAGAARVCSPDSVSVQEDQDAVVVTFDLPRARPLSPDPVLMLAFESLPSGEMNVTFTSESLQPSSQSVCLSGGTRYVALTAKSSEGNTGQTWRLSARTQSPEAGQNAKAVLSGGKSGSNTNMVPLLLVSSESEANESSASSQTSSFFCELRRFLDAVLPQQPAGAPSFPLESLQSLPRLPLGLSSSEGLLAGVMNSSAPALFSFSSSGLPELRGQLALPPPLLQELSERLQRSQTLIAELIGQGKLARRAAGRLERLRELSGFQSEEPTAGGESQYRAFLLLKALQTVAHTYNMRTRLRATRAGPVDPSRGSTCGLRSLTVSFTKLLLGPHSANINNCRGSCSFPLINGNNHAVLINSHVEGGHADERAPCCVPVAYDPLEVLDWNDEGSFLSIKTDMIAKECGCR